MAHERIQISQDVMIGKPVVRGTRVTVEQVLRECAAGLSAEQIVAQYPNLTAEDVTAALGFAAYSSPFWGEGDRA